MNSHRDSVKDALSEAFDTINSKTSLSFNYDADIICTIADAVFDAIGIAEEEQDAVGGHFQYCEDKRILKKRETANYRRKVKDTLLRHVTKWLDGEASIQELVPEMTDAVFDAIGITEEEQASTGGYFQYFAGNRRPMTVDRVAVIIEYGLSDESRAKLVRNLFMTAFRDDNGLLVEAMSADDCCEVFLSILKNNSDLTYQTLCELVANYEGGAEDFVVIPMTEEIKAAYSGEEAVDLIQREMEKINKKAEGTKEADDDGN